MSFDLKKLNNAKFCWLDVDPGHDDALAIILACFNKSINLIGISTVSGNQTIEKTTRNALNVLNLIGMIKENDELTTGSKLMPFPLIQGSPKPLLRKSVICEEIHGESGLETHSSFKFPIISDKVINYIRELNSQKYHFSTLIYNYLKESPEKVILIATGPLTNIALLLINHPDAVNYIESIVFMGGACGIGNTGPVAEFNIQVDPEAAHVVLESCLPIYMVPLEVTHTALVTKNILERIDRISSNFSKIITELLLFFKSTYNDVFGMKDPPLHDPTAVFFVINKDLFEYRLMRVDVECSSNLSYGQTVCDIYGMSKKRKNVHVCLNMNVDEFWNHMIDAIKQANISTKINQQIN